MYHYISPRKNKTKLTFGHCTWMLNTEPMFFSFAHIPLQPPSLLRGHSCAQSDALIHQYDPGPLPTEDEAGSCLTLLRSAQWAVKTDHLHTLLQSILHSHLTVCVSATQSCHFIIMQQEPQINKWRKKQTLKMSIFSKKFLSIVL